jgi:UDP-N-acetylmuramoyl-L-alanyl-D-glutamate--2,6-diaminopimelate ligase
MSWSLSGLVRAAGVHAEITGDAAVGGITADSRTVASGDLFCCIPGAVVDGHDFAADAVAAGAAALVVQRPVGAGVPEVRVPSVRAAVGLLADAFFEHPSGHMDVAAVTGTNGKTTITYLLEAVARAGGREPGVIGTVSRRFAGTSETAARNTPEAIDLQRLLRRMRDAGCDLVALEATSDGLEQGRLRGTRVASAGFTNLTQDHLNTHGSMEAYFEAKASLFDVAYTRRAVVNIGDPAGRAIRARASKTLEVLTYGSQDADIACTRIEIGPTGSRAEVRTPSGAVEISTALRGRYNVDNCLCAAGMALQLGLDLDAISAGIRGVETVPGRLEPVESGRGFLVLVDYAHTPDALGQALGAARELASGRLICVFGCGGDRDRAKRPQMGEIATRAADTTIITSDNPRSEDPMAIIREIEAGAAGEYSVVADRREAIASALAEAMPGDVVLVAGKGHEQGQTIGTTTLPFDDRDVVRELLGGSLCPS